MNRKGSKKTAFIYLAPAMIVILVFLYLPIILNFMNSLYEWGAVSKDVTWIGIENYKELLQDETIRIAIKNNLIFMIMSIICQIGVSLVIAAVLENKFMRRWQSIFRTIYFIPSLLMITVTGITFKMMSEAPKLPDVLGRFVDFVADDIVVGHNITFDISFINRNKHRKKS